MNNINDWKCHPSRKNKARHAKTYNPRNFSTLTKDRHLLDIFTETFET
jgi:hypothetical protein